MNSVHISGWVRSTPVATRLGPHTVYAEFRLGLDDPGTATVDAAMVVFCHGRLAQRACGHLDIGDVVEVHGFLQAVPVHDTGDSPAERVLVIADRLGLPGRPAFGHAPFSTAGDDGGAS
jgi:hypothetical protein